MIEQRYKDLIDKLIESTLSKKISWQITTDRESEFRVTLGSNTLTTDNWVLFENNNKCVDLSIRNQQGVSIYRIAFEDNDLEGEDYAYLMRLYSAAKDSYYKVDDTIADIMDHLN
jgi:hypothetical protein